MLKFACIVTGETHLKAKGWFVYFALLLGDFKQYVPKGHVFVRQYLFFLFVDCFHLCEMSILVPKMQSCPFWESKMH